MRKISENYLKVYQQLLFLLKWLSDAINFPFFELTNLFKMGLHFFSKQSKNVKKNIFLL